MTATDTDDATSPVEVSIPVPPAVLGDTPIGGLAAALAAAAQTAYAAAADHADAVAELEARQSPATRRRLVSARAAAVAAVHFAADAQAQLGAATLGAPGREWQSRIDRNRADAYRRLREALTDVDAAIRSLHDVDDGQAYLDAVRLAAADEAERWPVGYGAPSRTVRIGGRRIETPAVTSALVKAYRSD